MTRGNQRDKAREKNLKAAAGEVGCLDEIYNPIVARMYMRNLVPGI